MKLRHILTGATIVALTATGPASACDLDGVPGMGGFHRFNPFLNAVRGLPEAVPAPQARPSSTRSDAQEKKADRKRRQKAIEPTPKREWERDDGNGSISEADKATFT